MNKNNKYYKKSNISKPHKILEIFMELNKEHISNAIDIGCGVGRDSIFLIKNGYEVLAIDKEDMEYNIRNNLSVEENRKFRFLRGNFENLKFPTTDLIVSNFALSFCAKKKF